MAGQELSQNESAEELQGVNSRSWVLRIVICCYFIIILHAVNTEIEPEQRGEALNLQEFSSVPRSVLQVFKMSGLDERTGKAPLHS